MTDAQHQALQGASETFADFERRIERALGGNKPIGNPAKFNEIVSVHIDEIYAVLLALQRSSEGVEDERS